MNTSGASPTPDTDTTSANNDDKNQKDASQSQQPRQRQPSLLDSLLVSPAHDDATAGAGFGILCNDPSGLCLSATGSFLTKEASRHSVDDRVNSGVYTNLTKLAAQLHPDASAAPLITIESGDSNVLIKEYDGHAIALKVPVLRAASPTSGGGNGGSGGGTTNSNQSGGSTENGTSN